MLFSKDSYLASPNLCHNSVALKLFLHCMSATTKPLLKLFVYIKEGVTF